LLITGAEGMLGRTLMRTLAEVEPIGVDIDECDITDAAAITTLMERIRPDTVLHGAAMTAVDRCESESDLAWRVNAIGTGNVAIAAHRNGARLIAISTDYVFSGDLDRPYHEWDAVGPRSVYGHSKLAGEELVRTHCPDHVIARTAWLYGPGGPSFVHTMLRLGVEDGPPLKIVNDQIGNPTSTDAVADGLTDVLAAPIVGVMHLTCEGETSWFGLTRTLFELAGLTRGVEPCTTAEFPRPAPRPANSRLDNRVRRLHGLPEMVDWQEGLQRFLQEFPDGG